MAEPMDADRSPSEVTQLLRAWQGGNAEAASQLADALCGELRRLAAGRLRGERSYHTLQPTALVNEAWMRLAELHREWQSREHFLSIAAISMRRILVDHARRRRAAKRLGMAAAVPLDEVVDLLRAPLPDPVLLALDDALSRLAVLDPRQARVVELRYFAGLSVEETASVLGMSTGTVKREWAVARAWLFDAVHQAGPAESAD
jgi:RNA polymerase sigma factor (TIGR02999 family)